MEKSNLRKQLRRLRISREESSSRAENPSPSERAIQLIMQDLEQRRKLYEKLDTALSPGTDSTVSSEPASSAPRWSQMDQREREIAKTEKALLEREEKLRAHLEDFEKQRALITDQKILEKLQQLDQQISALAAPAVKAPTKNNHDAGLLQKPAVPEPRDPLREDLPEPSRPPSGKHGTGISRLDDLLGGGLPAGTNLLLNGSRHSGPDVLSRFLVAEGLRQGIPVIWVLTDQDMESVQEGMSAVLEGYLDFERRGLVRYVDLYSTRIGSAALHENVWHISVTESDALEKLEHVVSDIAAGFAREEMHYYLVFQSVSTLIASMDSQAILKFLLPFTGRRHREGAIAYYLVDPGVSQAGEIELLEHMMAGSINLKKEGEKYFLSIQGVGDEVRSRTWIAYTFARSRFQLGSFALTHIR